MQDVLEYAIPYHPALDLLRCAVFFFGVAILVYVAREAPRWHRRRSHPVSEMALLAALAGFALFAILQEIEQFGKPMVWWRPPLLLFVAVNAAVATWTISQGPAD